MLTGINITKAKSRKRKAESQKLIIHFKEHKHEIINTYISSGIQINNLMKKYLYLFVLCILLTGCSQPITYNGQKFPKTKRTDIYYATGEVTRPYKVMGRFKTHKYSEGILKAELVNFGQKIGADAIIILGTDSVKTNHLDAVAVKYE